MKIDFTTEDNVELTGHFYPANKAKAFVVINPATAIKTSYYRSFINFLNEHNYSVFIWNYRGFGESKRGSLKRSPYKYSDIGRFDIPAAFKRAKLLAKELPFLCIGHSVGGQHVGFVKNRDLLDGLLVVASSAGYFYSMPLAYRMKALFFFKIFAPLTALFCHYVPASRFNLMEDLPYPFVKEWGQLCNEKELFFSPKYFGKTIPDDSFQNLNFPLVVFVASDDEICTSENMENFWKYVKSKKGIEFKVFDHREYDKKKIGHFGYFKRSHRSIWNEMLNALENFS